MANRTFTHISVPFINNLAQEIRNSLTEVTNKITSKVELDTSLYNRKSLDFRTIIDNTFPTILIVDYLDIKKELDKYIDISATIQTEISEKATLPSKALGHLSNRQIVNIVAAVKSGINRLAKATTITEVHLGNVLSNILANPSSSTGNSLSLFKRALPGTYKITTNSNNREFYLFPNFTQVSGQLNKYINLAIEGTLAIEGEGSTGISSIGSALAYGHTAVGDATNVYINTPKILAIILDSINNSSATHHIDNKLLDMFLSNTMQIDTYIDVSKDFSNNTLSHFIQIGGNLVKYENTVINSLRGTHQEKTGNLATNKVVLNHLSKAFSNLTDSYSNIIRRAINKVVISRDSPSILDHIAITILNTVEGNNTLSFKLNKSIASSIKKTKEQKSTPKSSKSKAPKLTSTSIQSTQIRNYSLASLQALLDRHLQDVISANMGSGSERKVLNYRTGRLASSAKVERLSQSREGMITAFYSYMRNPYGTFSDGGKQQYPKSRNPKLLIAGAIREIAATQVGNRMRAVLV